MRPDLGIHAAAEALGLSTTTVRTLLLDGQIRDAWRTPGGHWRIPREAVETLRVRLHAPTVKP